MSASSMAASVSVADDFDTFHDRIVLGEKQVKRVESAAAVLIAFLTETLSLGVGDVFLQGSYANGTAIKPDPDKDDGEYDVDLVVVWARADATPEAALAELRAVVASNGHYADKIEDDDASRPCVRLRYADEEAGGFHVDVVPARRAGVDSPPLEIPRPGYGWRQTDPEGYRQWCEAQGEGFARAVKMLKRWRDHAQAVRDAIKSMVLQVLIADYVPGESGDAERIVGALRGISEFLAEHPDAPPAVYNPVLPLENLTDRWPVEDYQDFRDVVASAAQLAEDALSASSAVESRKLWQELFGDDFPSTTSVVKSTLESGEKDLELDFGIPTKITAKVSVNARVRPKDGFRSGSLAELSPLQKRRQLVFELAATTVSAPFDIYWKVKNRGPEARAANGLRGEVIYDPKGAGAWRQESTLYTGSHYVEIYVVKDGVCVARERVDVVIA